MDIIKHQFVINHCLIIFAVVTFSIPETMNKEELAKVLEDQKVFYASCLFAIHHILSSGRR